MSGNFLACGYKNNATSFYALLYFHFSPSLSLPLHLVVNLFSSYVNFVLVIQKTKKNLLSLLNGCDEIDKKKNTNKQQQQPHNNITKAK